MIITGGILANTYLAFLVKLLEQIRDRIVLQGRILLDELLENLEHEK